MQELPTVGRGPTGPATSCWQTGSLISDCAQRPLPHAAHSNVTRLAVAGPRQLEPRQQLQPLALDNVLAFTAVTNKPQASVVLQCFTSKHQRENPINILQRPQASSRSHS